jgi:hypothetical protein
MRAGWQGPGGPRRQMWPFAVSLAVHALLLLAWLNRPVSPRAADEQPHRLSVLLFPARPAPAAPVLAAPRAPGGHAAPAQRQQAAPESRAISLPDTAAALPPQAHASAALAEPTTAQPAHPTTADILASAHREIAKLAKEPGSTQPGALRPGDSAWSRFERGVADAHVERAPAPAREAYTSPDGTTYYRTRVGNSYVCRKTGTLDPS